MTRRAATVARVALALALTMVGACSAGDCRLEAYAPGTVIMYFDISQLSLPDEPQLRFNICVGEACDSQVRAADPPVVVQRFAGETSDRLDEVRFTVVDNKGVMVFTATTTLVETEKFRPNGEGCEPVVARRWFEVRPSGELVPVGARDEHPSGTVRRAPPGSTPGTIPPPMPPGTDGEQVTPIPLSIPNGPSFGPR